MTNEERMTRRLKIKIGALTVLLSILSLSVVFILADLSFVRLAMALTGNYSKVTGDTLDATNDWNRLDDDFVARTGGAVSAMQGALDMANNQINNLATPTVNADAANKQYVDSAVAGGGGGDTYTIWGRGTCPTGSGLLYSGFAFNNYYTTLGGSAEPICIQSGDPGPAVTGLADGLYPLGTGLSDLPPGIPAQREVRCAVCYRSGGTCYERWGSSDCPGAGGFTPAYTGYSMSGWQGHEQKLKRLCVDNVSFDGSVANNTWGAVLDSSMIWSNADIGLYTPNSLLKCSVCCN